MPDHRSTDKYTAEEIQRAATPGGSWRHPQAPRIGEYTLLRELGRGSFGVVYLAKRDGLERLFAIKLLLSGDAETVARFEVEARAAGKINDPGIVGVVDVGVSGERPYYVMDYCEGETLEERLRRGPMQEREAADLVGDLARTLAKVHARGVIHRDLKPANIILDAGAGRPRITDFGLARDFSVAGVTRSGETVGTPYFMAPEQLHSAKDVDARADVYALGVILYSCLTGQLPFPGTTTLEVFERIQRGRFPPPSTLVPGLSPALEETCLRAMSGDRAQRTQSCAELGESLAGFLGGSTFLDSSRRRTPTSGRKVGLLAGAALLAGCGVAFALHQRAQRSRLREAEAQLRLAEAHLKAGSEGVAALLDRTERLADGHEELLTRVAVVRRSLALDAAAAELRELVRVGATPQEAEEALKRAPVEARSAVEALAGQVARESLEKARQELSENISDEPLLRRLEGSLQVAEVLAAADEELKRSLSVARLITQARRLSDGEAGSLSEARRCFEEARRLQRRGTNLQAELALEQRRIEAREALASAGQLALARGEVRSVLQHLGRAEALAGEDPGFLDRVRLQRITTLYRRGRYREAIALSSGFSDTGGRPARYGRYMAGISHVRLEERQESRVLLEPLRGGEDGVAAMTRATWGILGDDRGERVVEEAEQALGLDPTLVDARISLAVGLRKKDPGRARAAAELALREAPDHPQAHLAQGLICEDAGDLVGAFAAYSNAIQLTEPQPSVSALSWRARVSLQRGQGERALEDVRRALQLRPEDPVFLVQRGEASFLLGQRADARRDWLRAALVQPEALRQACDSAATAELRQAMRTALAGGAVESGDDRDVLEIARELVAKQEPLDEALAKLGGDAVARTELYYARARFDRVVAGTQSLTGLSPAQRLRMSEMRAYGFYFLNRAEDCVRLLGSIYQSDPRGPVGLTSFGAFNVFQGRIEEAERLTRQALALDARNAEGYVNMGFVLLAQQRGREALEALRTALRLSPAHPRALYCWQSASLSLGDTKQAVVAAELLGQLNGDHPLEHFAHNQAVLALRVDDGETQRRALRSLTLLLRRYPPKMRERVHQTPLLRGLLYERIGERAKAAIDWRAAKRADPARFEQTLQKGLPPAEAEKIRAALRQE